MRNNQSMENALQDARLTMTYHGYDVDNFTDAGHKEQLYNHLRTLPNWDDAELRVSVSTNDTMYKLTETERYNIGDMVFSNSNLANHYNHATVLYLLSEVLRYNLTKTYDFICDRNYALLQEHMKERYNLNIRDNAKPSKLVANVYRKIGMSEYETKDLLDYLSCYAPSTTERTYYISINPLDYLTMSNGNTWHSCHILVGTSARRYGAGCYGQGCLSLWLDSSSAILYEESSDCDTLTPDINRPYKRGRRILNYGNNGILIQKGYGDCDGQRAISVLKSLYPYGNQTENQFNEDIEIDGAHYDDYGINSFFYNLPASLNIFNYAGIQVGSSISCVRCGETIEYNDEIVNGDQCNECQKIRCHWCNREIDPDDAINIDWDLYCPDCVERCDDCGDYFLPNHAMEIDGYTYCEACAENNAVICEYCGQIVHCENSHTLANGLWVCEDCKENEFK